MSEVPKKDTHPSVSEGLVELATSLGTSVHTAHIWVEALTHGSYAHEQPTDGPDYQRLEFLGDALLGAAVAAILHQDFPDAEEGYLSFLRSHLVRRESLAAWIDAHPVDAALKLGKGAKKVKGQGRVSILADVAESILAAIYLDHGWEALLQIVRAGPAANVPDYETARRANEPKSILQELVAARGEVPPSYTVTDRTKRRVTVRIDMHTTTVVGTGKNKKEAEADAATKAIALLEKNVE